MALLVWSLAPLLTLLLCCCQLCSSTTTLEALLARPALHHNPGLSRGLLNRAMSYVGDSTRIRKVADKLIDGEWLRIQCWLAMPCLLMVNAGADTVILHVTVAS